VELNGVDVKEGQLIGLVDGDLVASGKSLDAILHSTMTSFKESGPELLTVFTGEDATVESTSIVRETAETLYPDAEIEVVEGNQPHYQFVIAVE
jgi:dihydroxyacetone kinase-like predicted kinase